MRALLLIPLLAAVGSAALASESAMPVRVDLTSDAGVSLVKAQWRYSDARLVEVPFRAPDAEGQPLGAPLTTLDVMPQAGTAEFDDSAWSVIAPTSLSGRRGTGRVSFNWYRIDITVP